MRSIRSIQAWKTTVTQSIRHGHLDEESLAILASFINEKRVELTRKRIEYETAEMYHGDNI